MKDFIARTFNKKGIMNQIVLENEDKIAYQIASINNNLFSNVDYDYTNLIEINEVRDNRVLGFVVKYYRTVSRNKISQIKHDANKLDFSFMIKDFRDNLGFNVTPCLFEVAVFEDSVEYYFAVPRVSSESDRIVRDYMIKHSALNGK